MSIRVFHRAAVRLNVGFDDQEGKMKHTLGVGCLACENIDFICSRHHYASLMLMVELLQESAINTKHNLHIAAETLYLQNHYFTGN